MLGKRKCCCATNAVRILDRAGGACPYGRATIYDGSGSLVAEGDIGADGYFWFGVAPGTYRVVLTGVPRCATVDQTGVGFGASAGELGNVYRTFYVSSVTSGYAGQWYRIPPATGYGTYWPIPYPQVAALTLTDSVLGGSVPVAYSNVLGGDELWTGAVYRPFPVAPAGSGGIVTYRFHRITGQNYRVGASSPSRGTTNADAPSVAAWHPATGGVFDLTTATVAGHPSVYGPNTVHFTLTE